MASLKRLLMSKKRAHSSNVLCKTNGGLFQCNIRSGEFIPFAGNSDIQILSTCRGLVLGYVLGFRHPEAPYLIGNPILGSWKTLKPPPFELLRTGLARHPADNSVHLIGCDRSSSCCTYDFMADRWIPGPDHDSCRSLKSNLVLHRNSFYGFYMESFRDFNEDCIAMDPDPERTSREEIEADERQLKECDWMNLYRCELGHDPLDSSRKPWKRVELSSEVRRLLMGWEDQGLIVYRDRLLLYLWNGYGYKNDPRLKRRQIQRMYELLDDGRIVEDESWIDAADKLDPEGDMIPREAWLDVGYADGDEDFCWIKRNQNVPMTEENEHYWWPKVQKDIILHSGADDSLSEVSVPGGHRLWQVTKFEDYLDGEYDEFLSGSST